MGWTLHNGFIPETNKYSSWALRDVETVSLLADSGWGAIVAGDGEDGNLGRPQGAGTGPRVALDLSRVFRTFPKSLDGLPTGYGLFPDSPLLSLAFLSFFKKILFIFGRAGCSLLCGLFSGCGELGLPLLMLCRLLIAAASVTVEHRLELHVCGSCRDQGSNLCLLYWQV